MLANKKNTIQQGNLQQIIYSTDIREQDNATSI